MRAPTLLILALALIVASPAQSGAAPISVCMEQWAPYYAEDEDGVARGAAIDALDIALSKLGHTASYTVLPYGRCVRSVRLGRIDAILTLSPGEPGFVYVNVPLAHWTIAAIVHKDDPIEQFESVSQFADHTPIYFTSYSYPASLDDFLSKPDAIGISSQEDTLQPLRIVQARERHVVFEDMIWAKRLVRELNLNVKVLEPPVLTEPNYLAFSPERAAIALSVEILLTKMSADGRLQEIYARHIDDAIPGINGGS